MIMEDTARTEACDACGYSDYRAPDGSLTQSRIADAKVLVTLADGGKLALCGHDYRKHEVALLTQGAIPSE